MRVLIVDDHILFREGLVSLLKSQPNFEVVGEAGTVRQAIDEAHKLKPDLILMDYELPDGTGVEAMEAILGEMPGCMVVFLTVHQADEKLFAAIRKGAKGYLLKNVPVSNLLTSLQSLERGEPAISRAMTGRILEEFSRTERAPAGKPDALSRLSQRELEVLRELADGSTNRQIAQRLFIAENTVKHHIHSILDKLGFENRRQAADFARQNGLKSSERVGRP